MPQVGIDFVKKLAAGGVRGAKHDQKKQIILIYGIYKYHISASIIYGFVLFGFLLFSLLWILIGNETTFYSLMIYSLRLDLVFSHQSLVFKKFCLFLFSYLFYFVQGSLHYI